MRLYAKADTRFSLTAVWSSWSSGTLTKRCRNAFSKWTVPILPHSVGSTDYFSNANWRAPSERFHNSWIQSWRASPLQPERAETATHSDPTSRYSRAGRGQKAISQTPTASFCFRTIRPITRLGSRTAEWCCASGANHPRCGRHIWFAWMCVGGK